MNGESKGRAILGLCLGLWLSLGCGVAVAEEGNRVALVIGNGGYTALKTLSNPKNDAAAVARALKGLGYRLVDRDGKPKEGPELDLDQRNLIKAVNAFAQAAQGQEIAFLYYAGHGFQDGVNSYLVPVDAPKLESADELDLLKGRSVALDKVIRQVDGKAQMSVAVFDACREIPELNTAVRASGLSGDNTPYQGLLPVYRGGIRESGGQATPTSRLIAYAGAAGQLVKDGTGGHSPYTQLLLDQFEAAVKSNRNVELTDFFQQVAWNFKDQQKGQQPLVEVAAKPNTFYLLPGSMVIMPPPADYDLTAWQSAEKCGAAACYEAYRKAQPQGRFIELAKAQIDKLAPKPKVDTPLVEDLARQEIVVTSPKFAKLGPVSTPVKPGETIQIKILAHPNSIKAFAVFPFGQGQSTRVYASYMPSQGGIVVNYRIPTQVNSGNYKADVYVQEIGTNRTERLFAEFEIQK